MQDSYETTITNHIRRIPVVDHDWLLGIIALSDISHFKPVEIRRYLTYQEIPEARDQFIVNLVRTLDPIVVYQSK